ncbi:MAG: hypothetical protein OEO79_11460 [Gemmatimonadota bacterium]|nr:hypothetical protein [Gemmatimonadota bacterium]MDH3423968.1 hypothetical protein [Gemmatimonadota bacterium]
MLKRALSSAARGAGKVGDQPTWPPAQQQFPVGLRLLQIVQLLGRHGYGTWMYQEYANPVRVDAIDDAMSLLVDHFAQVFAIGLWNHSSLFRELQEEFNSQEEP